MFISVTRLHLKGKRMLPIFAFYTSKAIIQANKAKGVIHTSYKKEGLTAYWTLTVWESKAHMAAYRNNGSHLQAMKAALKMAGELETIHWKADDIPDWKTCKQQLHKKHGRNIS